MGVLDGRTALATGAGRGIGAPIAEGLAAEGAMMRVSDAGVSVDGYFAGNGDWHVFPTMVVLVEKSCLLGYPMRPDAVDPNRCTFDMFSLEHFAPGEVPETSGQEFERWQDQDGWGELPTQDLKNIGAIQAGMHSKGFDGLWLNTAQEMSIRNEHAIADRFIFGVGSR